MEKPDNQQGESDIEISQDEEEMTLTLPRNRMLTLQEAAEYLRRSPDTLRQQAGRGVLRAEKRGRDWLVSPLEVERYEKQHRRNR